MGKITAVIEGSTVGTLAEGRGISLPKEVSEMDSGRLIAAYAYTYREKWKNEDGTLREPTIEEVLQAWWDGIVAGSVAHVINVEKEKKAAQGQDEVASISVV